MADLTINDETFRVEVEGDAMHAPLMLSHALGADLSMWDSQMAALTARFRVVRYDTRGHGGSVAGNTSASIAQLGRDALAILDALEIEKVHWLGLSMGGAVGLWLLANAPERIERAVLSNTAPRLGLPEAWNARITAVLANGMNETAAATMERWFGPDFAARAPREVQAIHDIVRQTSPQGYAACCAALRDMDLRETLHGIEHEVLVITGRHDPVVPAGDVKAFVRAMSGARHAALETRHISSIEAAAEFSAVVLEFLTAKPARARAKPTAKAAARKASPRKAAPAKAGSSKRGGTTRRSNAARNPLKKAPAKHAAPKKAAGTATKKKPAEARRRPVAKATTTRRATPKVVAKKPPAKPLRKPAARRPTPTTTARSAVKVAVKKTKPGKAIAKTTKKTAAKSPSKSLVKSPTKKLPASRRKPAIKPRRPGGRRKP